MPRTLNIAVIGAGTMSQSVHMPVLRRRWDRFAITALVDHSPRRREESSAVWGVAEEVRYATVADLIAAMRAKEVEVDAALLATDGLHVEDLLLLLRRGIPVLVEPPLGYGPEEVARISDFERLVGRRLVMMAYPQQYDEVIADISEHVRERDVRIFEHEVLMPASQPLFGHAHVTSSAYDLPTEKRKERRQQLQDAVVAGAGEAATQRDRDVYVKGLLTGVAHQLAVAERIYGPVTKLVAARQWPKGVIPGSIEILGELAGGAPVRLMWHYLPFSPEYSEHLKIVSARRRVEADLAAPSHEGERSHISRREKEKSKVVVTSDGASKGAAESMWEAFYSFVDKGTEPFSGAREAGEHLAFLHEVLARIVEADGRSLEPAPEHHAEDSADEGAEAALEDEEASGGTTTSAAADGTDTGNTDADVEGDAEGADAEAVTVDADADADAAPAPAQDQEAERLEAKGAERPAAEEVAGEEPAVAAPEPAAPEPAVSAPEAAEEGAASEAVEPEPTNARPMDAEKPVDAEERDVWGIPLRSRAEKQQDGDVPD